MRIDFIDREKMTLQFVSIELKHCPIETIIADFLRNSSKDHEFRSIDNGSVYYSEHINDY